MEPQVAGKAASSRDAIMQAVDKLEDEENQSGDTQGASGAPLQQTGEAGQPAVTDGKPAEGVAGVEQGDGALGIGAKPAEAKAQGQDAAQAKPAASLTDTPSAAAQTRHKAPASWKPQAREHFAALPPLVQEEVLRREYETQQVLQDNAQARQVLNQLSQTIQPYQQVIALEGGDPIKGFGDYLRTASVLRMGTPMEKASAVAHAIRTFGVDVELLDTAIATILSGKAGQGPGPGQVPQQQQFRDPRVDELLNTMQQRDQQEQAVMESELTSEIATFAAKPENEFFEDLREDISSILSVGVQRGRVIPLAEAYRIAASMHPEISKVVQQRAAAAKVAEQAKAHAARKSAAVSISTSAPSQTGGLNPNEKGPSTREAIEQAMEALE